MRDLLAAVSLLVWSLTVYASAEDQLPAIIPYDVQVHPHNETTLEVMWTPPEGDPQEYKLKFWMQDQREADAHIVTTTGTECRALIKQLKPDTHYFVKVAAVGGPESERRLERTYRKAPQGRPSELQCRRLGADEMYFSWRTVKPAIDEEPILGYKIRIHSTDQYEDYKRETKVLIGNKLEAIFGHLTLGKYYKIAVLAYSNGGEGGPAILQFKM